MGWFSPKQQSPRDAVRSEAAKVLRSFVQDSAQRYSGDVDSRRLARAFLAFGHYACEKAFQDLCDDRIGVSKGLLEAIKVSPISRLQRVYCGMQIAWAYQQCLSDLESAFGWISLLSEGACDMYMQPPLVFDDVDKCFAEKNQQCPESDGVALMTRVENCAMNAAYEDIECREPHFMLSMGLMSSMRRHFDLIHDVGEQWDGGRVAAGQILIEREWNL
jgi:hypothetical protein